MDVSKIKEKVLQDLIEEMEGRMVSSLKEKSPKFKKTDPEMPDELDKEPNEENPEEDEETRRLMEMYKQLK